MHIYNRWNLNEADFSCEGQISDYDIVLELCKRPSMGEINVKVSPLCIVCKYTILYIYMLCGRLCKYTKLHVNIQ